MRTTITSLLVLSTLAVAGCGDGPTELGDVTGDYEATRFLFSGPESGDVLALGGGITITLNADLTTSGTMQIPAELSASGLAETLNLSGTFTLTDDVIHLMHSADTFLRDADWDFNDNELRSIATFGDTTIDVVLRRQ